MLTARRRRLAACVLPSTVFTGLGPPTNRKAANLAVTNGPPRTRHLADYGNIEEGYYGNMVNIREYMQTMVISNEIWRAQAMRGRQGTSAGGSRANAVE